MTTIFDAFILGVKIAVTMLSCALVLILVCAVIAGIASIGKKDDSDE